MVNWKKAKEQKRELIQKHKNRRAFLYDNSNKELVLSAIVKVGRIGNAFHALEVYRTIKYKISRGNFLKWLDYLYKLLEKEKLMSREKQGLKYFYVIDPNFVNLKYRGIMSLVSELEEKEPQNRRVVKSRKKRLQAPFKVKFFFNGRHIITIKAAIL